MSELAYELVYLPHPAPWCPDRLHVFVTCPHTGEAINCGRIDDARSPGQQDRGETPVYRVRFTSGGLIQDAPLRSIEEAAAVIVARWEAEWLEWRRRNLPAKSPVQMRLGQAA